MARTFNDFLFECDNFDHSEEYYGYLKECHEMDLMATFLENQQFVTENSEVVGNLNEGVEINFTESASSEDYESIVKNFNEKVNKTHGSFWNKVKGLIRTICNFFRRIANSFDADTKAINSVRKNVAAYVSDKGNSTEAIVKKLADIATSSKVNIMQGQPYVNRLKKQCNITNGNRQIMDYLAAALSDDIVILAASKNSAPNEKNEYAQAIEAKKLAKIMKAFGGDKLDVKAATSELQTLINTSHTQGITINVNGSKLNSMIEELESFAKTLDESAAGESLSLNDMKNEAAKKKAQEDEDKGNFNKKVVADNSDFQKGSKSKVESAQARLDYIVKLQQSVSSTCKLYNAFNSYRHAVIKELSKAVNQAGEDTTKKKNEKDKEEENKKKLNDFKNGK